LAFGAERSEQEPASFAQRKDRSHPEKARFHSPVAAAERSQIVLILRLPRGIGRGN
jgi:hypothetical protein